MHYWGSAGLRGTFIAKAAARTCSSPDRCSHKSAHVWMQSQIDTNMCGIHQHHVSKWCSPPHPTSIHRFSLLKRIPHSAGKISWKRIYLFMSCYSPPCQVGMCCVFHVFPFPYQSIHWVNPPRQRPQLGSHLSDFLHLPITIVKLKRPFWLKFTSCLWWPYCTGAVRPLTLLSVANHGEMQWALHPLYESGARYFDQGLVLSPS